MSEKREEREMNVYLDGILESMPVFAKELITGGVAGGVAKTVVTPLERIRWIILAFPEMGRGPGLDLAAGSFAGGSAVLFTYPLDLIRTKLAYQVAGSQKLNVQGVLNSQQIHTGILDCFSMTCREAGLRGLYRGGAPSLYGLFPSAGLKFYFYEEMKRHVPPEQKKSIVVKLVCGSVAGVPLIPFSAVHFIL